MRTLRMRLRKILSTRFSRDELRTLCFDLGIPYENLPQRLDGLAREMIVYCENRDRLPELIDVARGMRPDIDWGDLVPESRARQPRPYRSAGPPARVPPSADAIDAASVASAAIALLSPYLAQAGEDVDEEAGEAAWDKARQIHQAIATRLRAEEDDYAPETLERFEEKPESRRGAMQSVLREVLDKDPAFAQALLALLQEADQAGAGAVFNVTVLGGEVGNVINVDRLEGGLTINQTGKR